MSKLFLFNIKPGLQKKTKWKYQQRIYRAFNKHSVRQKEYPPTVCQGDFLDKSAVLIDDTNSATARKFFRSILEYFDVTEIDVNSMTKLKWLFLLSVIA
jgi:hypothetical protein